MNVSWRVIIIAISSLIFFFSSCDTESAQQEKPKDYQSLIIGQWDLFKGFRDKKESSGLTNTKFNFQEGGKMTSNFNMEGELLELNYQLKDQKIIQTGKPAMQYDILEASDSTLTLKTVYRGYNFKLLLKKSL